MQVLAGDIGGTKTLLAVCEVVPRPGAALRVEVLASKRYDSRQFPGLGVICRAFAAELDRPLPPCAGFGIAGPVVGGRSHTTNLPWIVDARDLSRTLGISSVRLANDFLALALGIESVRTQDLIILNEGAPDPTGPRAVLGAGTGLGEAVIVGLPGASEVIASEGGHATFAPRTELEIGILRFLMQRYEHVSWERVLSGDGLVNLVEALAQLTGLRAPDKVQDLIDHDRTHAPPAVTDAAAGGDPLCRRALELFCTLYGSEAGNLALKALATGGVYVAGGIAPRILDFLKDGRFREAFFEKGRMRPVLERIPVEVVLDPEVGLLGAAALAARAAHDAASLQTTSVR